MGIDLIGTIALLLGLLTGSPDHVESRIQLSLDCRIGSSSQCSWNIGYDPTFIYYTPAPFGIDCAWSDSFNVWIDPKTIGREECVTKAAKSIQNVFYRQNLGPFSLLHNYQVYEFVSFGAVGSPTTQLNYPLIRLSIPTTYDNRY